MYRNTDNTLLAAYALWSPGAPASSCRTLVNSTSPDSPKLTNQRTPDRSLPPQTSQSSSSFSQWTGGCVSNHFLLRKDAQNCPLTLLPGYISSHRLNLNAPMNTNSDQPSDPPLTNRPLVRERNLCWVVVATDPYNGEGRPNTGGCEDEGRWTQRDSPVLEKGSYCTCECGWLVREKRETPQHVHTNLIGHLHHSEPVASDPSQTSERYQRALSAQGELERT
ncbi:hypothetical protein DPEC_G00041010 [Dallia pectoralis]|uniref:Uncharacterized protein n=1 Tax=Dallia pectoralis TaxID=75939 RepID=A0ACC2HGA1_DALPE|nr:hypothetical protein DPEC_G00041010 [Dallia pectoralis]